MSYPMHWIAGAGPSYPTPPTQWPAHLDMSRVMNPERTPTPPLVELPQPQPSSSSSSSQDDDQDDNGSISDSSSSSGSDISDTSFGSDGSGDDYAPAPAPAPQQVTGKSTQIAGKGKGSVKGKEKQKQKETGGKGKKVGVGAALDSTRKNKIVERSKKALAASAREDENEGEVTVPVDGKGSKRARAGGKKGKNKAGARRNDDGDDGQGVDTVFDMLAESVSKAASGNDLAVDDDRFEAIIKDVNDDEDEDELDGKRVYRRPVREHRPSPEVARLLGEANASYAINGPSEAVEIYLQVVRHDQYITQAWTSLASCYEELGRGEAARQMRFFAAHVDKDGDKWAALASEYKEMGQMNQCIYCLTQALRVDPSDVEALWDLATIHRTLDNKLKAVRAFQRLVKHDLESAHNFTILEEFYPLILETNQLPFGAQAYRAAFDYHLESFTHPNDDEEGNTMGLEHIVPLVDMLIQTEKLEEGVDVVRRGQRWLQGRMEEKHWDVLDDDREYASLDDGEGGDEGNEGNELEVPLRLRLALLRLRLGQDDDAFGHINAILSLDVVANQEMFIELGEALMKRELWEKALDCFAPINEEESIDDTPGVIYSLGVCLHETGKSEQAVEYLRWVIAEDEEHLEARLRLANVLEEQGHKAEALDIVTEVLRRRAQQGPLPQKSQPQPRISRVEKAAHRTFTKRMLEDQMRQKMVSLWQEVLQAEKALDEGDVDALGWFIEAAGTMIDNHRMAKHMFGRHRGVKVVNHKAKYKTQAGLDADVRALQDRLERSLGFEEEEDTTEYVRMTEFYGLTREDWLSLVIKYCCVLMAKEENAVAMEILEQMVWSAIFFYRRGEIALRLTIIACAIRTKAHDKVAENCRRLSQLNQFKIEPILLLQSALAGGGTNAHTVWCSLNIQRFIHRELRLYESAIDGVGMHFSKREKRWALPSKLGVSRILDDLDLDMDMDIGMDDDNEGEGDEDDDGPGGHGGGGGGGKGEKAGGSRGKKQGRKSGVPKSGPRSNPSTLAEAMDMDENQDGDEDDDEVDDGEGGGEGESWKGKGVEEIPKRPTMVSPYWSAVYGQYMLASHSYHGALYYLIRAYEIDPYDSYICFMIAQSYFGRAMNRQSDNRNYQIAQGLVFMTKYRKLALRDSDPQAHEEIEYNYGRSFHGLGIPHLAVVHYERVLTMVRQRMDGEEHDEMKDAIRRDSLACSAAHNLILLYTATGSFELVKEKSLWLAI